MMGEACNPPNAQPATPIRGGLAGWQVRKLGALAAGGDLRALTAAGLAREVRLSTFHFSRAFRSTMGVTPGRWLTRARVDRARILLGEEGITVSEVARRVGYRGAPQLARAFRAHFDVCPSRFRKMSAEAPARPAPAGPPLTDNGRRPARPDRFRPSDLDAALSVTALRPSGGIPAP